MAEYFVFYKSFYDAINILDDDASKMRVINALAEYAFNSKDLSEKLSGAEKVIYLIATPLIDACIRNYENGKKGGRSRNAIQINTSKTPLLTPVETNNNNKNKNEKENEKEKAKTKIKVRKNKVIK